MKFVVVACSRAGKQAARPLQNQVRRISRVNQRRIDDQAGSGLGLVFVVKDILPCRIDEARNVGLSGFHASAVFRQIGADNFNLELG